MEPQAIKTCYGRFKGLPWFDKISNSRIFIGGAGGIGSHLAFYLARTGAQITIIDMDTVGEENLAGQLYGSDDVGKKKVQAISDVIFRLCDGPNVTPLDSEVTDDPDEMWRMAVQSSDVVCVGFDNLKARETIYKEWRANGRDESLFVDGRLGAESGQVFVLSKKDPEDNFLGYEATYFPESERTELPCTMKATTHCGALIASLMVAQITNWFNNISEGTMGRNINNVEYHIPLMMMDFSQFKIKQYVEAVEDR